MHTDKVDITSLAVSVALHFLVVAALSGAAFQNKPLRVALITDVTLIDVKDYKGKKGEEKQTAGLEKKQKKTAEVIKKKEAKKKNPVKNPVKKEKQPDIKSLLKKIEAEKSRLDMGISRETLAKKSREMAAEDAGDETAVNAFAAAGSDPVITGDIATRKYRKLQWQFPKKLPEETELAIEVTVMPSGLIRDVKLVRASGYPDLDRMALQQARSLEFEGLGTSARQKDHTGILLFKFGAEK